MNVILWRGPSSLGAGGEGGGDRDWGAPRACSAARICVSTAAGVAIRGGRHSPTSQPVSRSAHLTGIGLAMEKSASNSGRYFRWSAVAVAVSPDSKAAIACWICSPIRWLATLTTPRAPTESSGRVSASSPE